MSILRNFIRGLIKSFDGKDYLREIYQCNKCGKPSFTDTCLYCETVRSYDDENNKT
jgi:hypothetical protein